MTAGHPLGPVEVVRRWLADCGAAWREEPGGRFTVSLPGERKQRTACSLAVGDHSLSVSAFVVRRPDENHAAVHRWLLERNARLPGLAFCLDRAGDVYLVGRLPVAAVTPEAIDALLGAVLHTADSCFDPLLELGFASSIRAEWRWRLERGEPTANLAAFERLRPADPSQDHPSST